jgi:hypothetical protein
MVSTESGGLGPQGRDQRDHPGDLHLGRNRLGAGPGGFAADVQDLGPLGEQPPGVGERRLGREVGAAVGEAVRRDIDDPHDAGSGRRGG